MARREMFTCPHPEDAEVVYVATFSKAQRVRMCKPCQDKINADPFDRRGVGKTKTEAAAIRDPKLASLAYDRVRDSDGSLH